MVNLLPLLDHVGDILGAPHAVEQIAGGLERRIDLQSGVQVLLGGRNVLAIEVQVGHLVVSHGGSLHLTKFFQGGVHFPGIEQDSRERRAVRTVLGLQIDRFLKLPARLFQVAGSGMQATEFCVGVRVVRSYLDGFAIELRCLDRILLLVVQASHRQQGGRVLGFDFESAAVTVHRFGIVALRLEITPLGNEDFRSDTDSLVRGGRGFRGSDVRCRREGAGDRGLGLAVRRRHGGTYRGELTFHRGGCLR